MPGSGWKTVGTSVMTAHRPMARPGWRAAAPSGCSGAARGAAGRGGCVPPTATGTTLTAGVSTWAFASPRPCRAMPFCLLPFRGSRGAEPRAEPPGFSTHPGGPTPRHARSRGTAGPRGLPYEAAAAHPGRFPPCHHAPTGMPGASGLAPELDRVTVRYPRGPRRAHSALRPGTPKAWDSIRAISSRGLAAASNARSRAWRYLAASFWMCFKAASRAWARYSRRAAATSGFEASELGVRSRSPRVVNAESADLTKDRWAGPVIGRARIGARMAFWLSNGYYAYNATCTSSDRRDIYGETCSTHRCWRTPGDPRAVAGKTRCQTGRYGLAGRRARRSAHHLCAAGDPARSRVGGAAGSPRTQPGR